MRLGILLLTIFLVLEGFTDVLFGVGMMLEKGEVYEIMKKEFERVLKELNATHVVDVEKDFAGIYEAISVTAILFGVLYLIVAIGIALLRSWARIGAIVLLVLQLVYSLATIHLDLTSIFGIILSASFLWYLSRRDVGEMFSRKKTIEERILGKEI